MTGTKTLHPVFEGKALKPKGEEALLPSVRVAHGEVK